MMKLFENPGINQWTTLSARPALRKNQLDELVQDVFKDIQNNGQEALIKYANIFEQSESRTFRVSDDEYNKDLELSEDLKKAIDLAYDNISTFHEAQIQQTLRITTSEGVECWMEQRPIEKVGLYIPGGTAPLFSTLLMLGIPAKIAGCEEIILCSPCSQGDLPDELLYIARKLNIREIFKIGGIQAIAGMSLGSTEIPQVYKIYGPGNQYVTAAKSYSMKFGTGIDMPAGPSEVLVLADQSADPSFIASDLLAQAEHGIDSQVILVSDDIRLINEVNEEINRQIEDLPRKEIAIAALENSRAFYFDRPETCLQFSNAYAPEHLILQGSYFENNLDKISNAGSVFVGAYSPESVGDYASGTNHTLPTSGAAKLYSGVGLESFQKRITFQKLSKRGLENLGKAVIEMAEAEGLKGHANAVRERLKQDL
jgi:histidinol dehydrogenase